MTEIYLDFEKPIIELKRQIESLKRSAEAQNGGVSKELMALQEHLDRTMEEIYGSLSPWQKVLLARHPERPYTMDYIGQLFTDFLEFHGDRRFADDKAIIGGFARFGKHRIMVIGTQKGRDMKSNVYRNFGWPHPEGYRKALRLMQMAELARTPIVTFIDTPGAYPGLAAEERHVGEAIAVNLREMFSLTVPVIAIVIGEGGSGGAIGIGVGNRLLILENAYYSVITPEGCAAILWKDKQFAPKAADALQLTADKLYQLDIADEIVPEPFGGAQRDWSGMAELLSPILKKHLSELEKFSPEELKQQRYEKFRKVGVFSEKAAKVLALKKPGRKTSAKSSTKKPAKKTVAKKKA